MALIQIRRGTAAGWTSENPILESGELGHETDTKRTKVGNGVTAWSSLDYAFVTIADIDVAGATSNQTLVYNGTKFVPGAATSSLDSLSDVTAPTPSSNDIIKWNGSAWVNDSALLAAKAPLANPTFTGVPAAPTAEAGTNTTQIATTAFVTASGPSETVLDGGSPNTIQWFSYSAVDAGVLV